MTTKGEVIEKYKMLPAHSRVLCAVSGGADSIYLLHYMLSLAEEKELDIFAAHYNHLLRGEESDRDAAFTEESCARLGVPLVTGSGDVQRFAREKHCGLEEAARTLRYRFLEETADRMKCDRIATAHNGDDNAETMLMNLCRGAGITGLSGIPPVRGRLIRPLLQISRREIEAYLCEHGISYVVDSSNLDDAYTRNRFRKLLHEFLIRENPSFLEATARTAELLRMDNEYLERLAAQFIQENYDGTSLPGKKLSEKDPAVSTRVVRRLCGGNLSMERTQAVLRFAAGNEHGVLELPGRKLIREHGRLYFAQCRETGSAYGEN